MTDVDIYTDGACRGNPGPGGWGALLIFKSQEKELSGAESQTTNNRMELMGAIMALAALTRGCHVRLHTDSKYVCTGVTDWLPNWQARGWKTADKKPVKNQDLWERLDAEAQRHDVKWIWVKGHAGNEGNERVDRIANAAIDELLSVDSP